MEREYVQNGMLYYRKLLTKKALPVKNIIWAYLQEEAVHASMCCGSFNSAIGRLILRTEENETVVFQYEGLEKPKKLLAALTEANPGMAVGYTAENRKKFGEKK